MLTPPQLQAVREVVATGSFRTAARRLGYTPSAVSQQIAGIERALGVSLFTRSPRSVRPTPAGLQLAGRAERLLADLSAAEEEMRGYAAAERGRLRLGSFWSAGYRLVPTVLTGFLRDRPQVEVRYEEGDPQVTVPAVLEGRLDLAVVFEYGVVPQEWPEGLEHTLVLEEPLYVLLPPGHRLAGRGQIRLADLRHERWISYHEDTDASRCLQHICAAGGFRPEVLFRTNDYNLPYELVRRGLGVALAPELAVVDPPGDPAAHLVRLTGPAHTRRIYATRRTTDPSPFLPQALELLHSATEALPPREGLATVV
ncbi:MULTISPECIES: LysR family transcriptional regulator [unclassified Streptomyces]|uniref:LysR family transcriptional regulator n=1 Tax=unclassified Streptomyces TaxID=2593676 RepID=UPI002DD96E6E|nr:MULTISPECIES: LysR family transcriptional regulator [unclassified Streptomyces]WSA93041.1 LysR family transcriptional regulator [Streptomyces sp. NBC_01795]WSB77411.1 LysR family transcriptional regulator [Streptomyces sp. NBC_01775]WSS14323.1 LysR family transcriptional regulator [Streptomyces sp. NBC_01186]WSS43142.1 LysR family transcriptional regulator [Streptomyces sp. NBC_01187]